MAFPVEVECWDCCCSVAYPVENWDYWTCIGLVPKRHKTYSSAYPIQDLLLHEKLSLLHNASKTQSRSFAIVGPLNWNNLPQSLRDLLPIWSDQFCYMVSDVSSYPKKRKKFKTFLQLVVLNQISLLMVMVYN